MSKISTLFNKRIRAGATIIIQSQESNAFDVGSRGITLMPIVVNWGESDKLTTITKNDLLSGTFYKKFGDTDTLNIELALLGCEKVLIYPMNKGNKATATVGSALTVTAKYTGTFGNSIKVGVTNNTVQTEVNGEIIDAQELTSDYNELIENDYVTFQGSGSPQDEAFTSLTGGTNGTNTDYSNFVKSALRSKWNVLACVDKNLNTQVKTLVENLREVEGKKVQCVMVDDSADYEGIIKLTEQKVKYNNIELQGTNLTAYVSGITAGATIQTSNTGKITPFTEIIDDLLNTEIEQAILKGYFIFTYRENGKIQCEQDINSFTSFTPTKQSYFRKNKIIRVFDEINNTVKETFDNFYKGELDNNLLGRTTFKGALVEYFTNLKNLNAIDDFDTSDIIVQDTSELDAIHVQVAIKPVDKVEKLYMLVKVK